MKRILIILYLLSFPRISLYSDFYEEAGKVLYRDAVKNKINIIAIIPFNSKNSVVYEEVEYIQERISEELYKNKDISLIDSYLATKIKKSLTPQAVITGNVYESENGIKVVIKMISVENSKLISMYSGEIKKESILPDFNNLKDFEITPFDKSFDLNQTKKDFRDSIDNLDDCGKLKEKLIYEQKELNDIKAKYWSIKLKDKSFTYDSVRINPGSEILDSSVKDEFYSKIKSYYYTDRKIFLTEEDNKKIRELFKKERDYIDRCGI